MEDRFGDLIEFIYEFPNFGCPTSATESDRSFRSKFGKIS